ncbi:L-carnitine--corrinoid protein Co-methyltransferase MtcB [Alkalibacter mobilis]|uniref:L-carnitine--corrinoid protein Co-methyltransferase MtcB n=1 Tax=Alkalibacter mobilis TaxID=2787712 RepID=UPI00189E54C8|nr:trimethylamine methyltransferase family protein [Alkalibacter mobilis]MBF7095641.1 trimethylamine methyltransferase family protein [Alkalibacter mobilis]
MRRNSLVDLFYNEEDVERMHQNVVRVLSEVGVKFESEEALEVFKHHGAKVDGDVVYISEGMLENSLKTLPRNFELIGQGSNVTVGLDQEPVVIPTNGTPTVLHFDGTYADTSIDDLVNFYKLIDTSEVMKITSEIAVDLKGFEPVNGSTLLPQTSLLLKYSSKPIYNILGATIYNYPHGSLEQGARENIQFVKKYFDIWDKYVVYSGTCVLSPLAVNWEAMAHFMAFIKEKQPLSITACSMTNLTAPASLTGSIVQDCANILSIVVLAQLMEPGLPCLYTSLSSMSDMRHIQLCMGAPEFLLITLGHIALANYYNIPARVGGALGDAFEADYQAGVESFVGLMGPMLTQTAMIPHGAGTMGSFNLTSYEKFIMDEESIRYLLRLRKGVDNTAEKTISAFEAIEKAGPRGSYMKGRTPREYREEHYLASDIFNRKGCKDNTIEEQGTIRDRALAEYNRRMESYKLPDITSTQKKLLNEQLPSKFKF